MKNIILLLPYENHSNRLFQNLHAEAFCVEKNIPYFNPSFADISYLYNSACHCNFPKKLSFPEKVLCSIMKNNFAKKAYKKIFPKGFGGFYYFRNEIPNATDYIFKQFQKRNNIFVGGFNFRFPHLTHKHQDLFIEKYSLKKEFYENNDLVKKFIRKKTDKISIGVHVRRGDYKTYKNGIHYFEDETYKKHMDNFAKQINKDCIFLICSNEKTTFQNSTNILISEEEWFIDHYLLSNCDYIIGPVSTFSRWASFIGKVKIFHIKNDSGKISLDDFEYCTE
jgi:hypothetical protein